ncbi:hypothetical protein M3Y98_00222200 [Aphelenchoides besseyi]|nr:hypothetical protein M3Y98_00222200 [Aphelenchoides besseyi]KAI6200490.1 hypothetical protein M3Y96_00739700 [Aphelenchoides besseyi]
MVRSGDYRDELPRRYQEPQHKTYSSSRRRSSPSASSSRYDRRGSATRRDSDYRNSSNRTSTTSHSRERTAYRRPTEPNPFNRRSDDRRSDRYGSSNTSTSYQNSHSSDHRRPAHYSSRWLPPVRNPAKYVDAPIRDHPPSSRRSKEDKSDSRANHRNDRESVNSNRRSSAAKRSRTPVDEPLNKKKRTTTNGPSTPPEPQPDDRSSVERQDEHSVGEDEIEILELIHVLFRYCYQPNKDNQAARFSWLKGRICDIRKEIDELQNGNEEVELEEVDCSEPNETNGANLSMVQNDILDYDEIVDAAPQRNSKTNNDDSDYELKSPVESQG